MYSGFGCTFRGFSSWLNINRLWVILGFNEEVTEGKENGSINLLNRSYFLWIGNDERPTHTPDFRVGLCIELQGSNDQVLQGSTGLPIECFPLFDIPVS